MYMDKGVFEVRDTPMSTMSAFSNPEGIFPSSYFTANSIASTFLKYSSSSRCIIPGLSFGFVIVMVSKVLSIGPRISTYATPEFFASLSNVSLSSIDTIVWQIIAPLSDASCTIRFICSVCLTKGMRVISISSSNCAIVAFATLSAVSPTESDTIYISGIFPIITSAYLYRVRGKVL